MVFGFWVLGFGFWVLGFGFWVLGFGFWVLGFGFWVFSFGFHCQPAPPYLVGGLEVHGAGLGDAAAGGVQLVLCRVLSVAAQVQIGRKKLQPIYHKFDWALKSGAFDLHNLKRDFQHGCQLALPHEAISARVSTCSPPPPK